MKLVFRIIVVFGFLVVIGFVIAYGRGYRWSFQNQSLVPTGIISANSSPNAAKIYVNGQLKGATDLNLTLPPATYTIEIKKDGYTSWTKTIKLQGELVYTIDAQLFPQNPSLSPLTNLGVVKTVPVDETDKIIIFTDTGNAEKDGIYLFDTAQKPLSLLPQLKLILLKKNLPLTDPDFLKTEIYFSPDYKEAIFDFNPTGVNHLAYLLSLDQENINPFEVTASQDTLIEAWQIETTKEIKKILETFSDPMAKIASDSFHIISFSPDKTKFLYRSNTNTTIPQIIKPAPIAGNQTPEQRNIAKNGLYVYDQKEDKNFAISNFKFDISNMNSIQWYPDSRHLVYLDGNKISVVDYDDANKQIIYSGPFQKSFFLITSDSKLIIMANLNPDANKFPDLYLVGIR